MKLKTLLHRTTTHHEPRPPDRRSHGPVTSPKYRTQKYWTHVSGEGLSEPTSSRVSASRMTLVPELKGRGPGDDHVFGTVHSTRYIG